MLDLQFKGFYIKKIEYNFIDEGDHNASIGYKIENISDYSYELYLEMEFIDDQRNDDKILYLCIQLSALFDVNGEDRENMPEDEIENLVKINGSAILFPYLRALVQNITSYDTSNEIIMLPPINVREVIEKIDNEKHATHD